MCFFQPPPMKFKGTYLRLSKMGPRDLERPFSSRCPRLSPLALHARDLEVFDPSQGNGTKLLLAWNLEAIQISRKAASVLSDAAKPIYQFQPSGVVPALPFGIRLHIFAFRVSCFVFRFFCFMFRISCFVLRVSCFLLRAGCFVSHAQGFRFRASGYGY
jgi:hypothetical protein